MVKETDRIVGDRNWTDKYNAMVKETDGNDGDRIWTDKDVGKVDRRNCWTEGLWRNRSKLGRGQWLKRRNCHIFGHAEKD